jgi:hypothetical protein
MLAGILDAIAAAPDLSRGLCAWNWDLFDAVDEPAAVEKAKSLCQQCRVLAQCAEWSDALPPNALHGVVAGRRYEWAPSRRKWQPPRQSVQAVSA